MTSAPVKSAGLVSAYASAERTASLSKNESSMDFGSAMNKATAENCNRNEASTSATAKSTKRNDIRKQSNDTTAIRKASQVSGSNETETTDSLEKQAEKVAAAFDELKTSIMETLDVSEEELTEAMEILGLDMVSVFDPTNLTQLVLNLNGETETSSLLTNEELFQDLQSLQQMSKELLRDLGESVSAMTDITESGFQDSDTGLSDGRNSDSGFLEENSSDEGLSGEQSVLIGNPAQNQNSVSETGFAQKTIAYSSNTQEIMDQILDSIKVRINPNVDSLEMQLHPQSLGTVHVQLTNHSGEITAQFHVQNDMVKNAVEGQMMELKEALDAQGVKVETIEVTVDTRGFESNLWQGQENQGQEAYERQRRTPRRINLADLNTSFEEEVTEEEELAVKMMEANGNTIDFTA